MGSRLRGNDEMGAGTTIAVAHAVLELKRFQLDSICSILPVPKRQTGMADQQDDDALFDRLAKSLEAVRYDAELARTGGAAGITASVTRAETELHRIEGEVAELRRRGTRRSARRRRAGVPSRSRLPRCGRCASRGNCCPDGSRRMRLGWQCASGAGPGRSGGSPR